MIYPESFEHKIGFDNVRDLIARQCTSSLGRQRCADMKFSTSFDFVERELSSIDEMMKIMASERAFPLDSVTDISHNIKGIRVPGAHIPAADLLAVRNTLSTIDSISAFFRRTNADEPVAYPRLAQLAQAFSSFAHIINIIDRVIDRHGEVRDNASPELAAISQQLASMSGTINRVMRKVIASAVSQGYLEPDVSPSVRDGRLVIPVAPMHKRKISGIVHDESASGKTYFIEPAEVVEANNRLRELEIERNREILRILVALADELRPYADEILASIDVLASFDFIYAKARFAIQIDAHLPHLSRKPEFEWYHAFHPVLKLSLQAHGKDIVPTDLLLNKKQRILIVSGPNAGGKSVVLKTAAIVQYMAQCGVMPTLYENSHMGIIRNIFIDIGDDQSIEDDLSTYSSHLRNMKYFLQRADGNTLILIDEFGGGTEPQIGGAIAQAILKEFNVKHAFGVITTHFQNLKQLAEETPGLVNGSMLYDRHLMQPLFKLSIGSPGSSFAIEIARKIGLPEEIMAEAEKIVGSDYVNIDKYLLDIARDKKYWESKRLNIKQKEKQLDQAIEKYETDVDTLRQHRREIINDAKAEAQRILDTSNASIERTILDIRQMQADKEKTKEARRRLAAERAALSKEHDDADEHPLLKKAPKPKKKPVQKIPTEPNTPNVTVGSNVLLDGAGEPGTVMEISGNNALVAFGLLKTKVKLSRLKPTIRKPRVAASSASSFVSTSTTNAMRDRQLNFKQEIDVRGMRADEAVQAVTYFIDDAIQFNQGRVRILHGTGTGALRQYIRAYLSTVAGVRSYHDEDVRFGGAGITVVEFE